MGAREPTAGIGELCAMLVKKLREYEELTPEISARCREIADAIRFQVFNSNPTPKVGDPLWRINYMLNDEPRIFRGAGDLGRLTSLLEDYALWIGKKLELTSATRIR